MKEKNLSLTSHTKVNLNWIKDLHIKPETVKFLQENRGEKQPLTITFLYMTPKSQATTTYKIKRLMCSKRNDQCERQPEEWEKIFSNYVSDRVLYPKYTGNSFHSIVNQNNPTQIKNEQRTQTDIFPKKICKWPVCTWQGVQHH